LFKFKDISARNVGVYHLEELNPVREHSEKFKDYDDEIRHTKES
jgi:hypothetical protein